MPFCTSKYHHGFDHNYRLHGCENDLLTDLITRALIPTEATFGMPFSSNVECLSLLACHSVQDSVLHSWVENTVK
jgi:hypothetical protein